MNEYKIKSETINFSVRSCMHCGSSNLEHVQHDQVACKNCRSLWFRTSITDEEMIEWFID